MKVETGKKEIPRTIFCDIDGTILKHHGKISDIALKDAIVLEGVVETFNEWCSAGYVIILVTGRAEPLRKLTEAQLMQFGIMYHRLIMDVGIGARILINDLRDKAKDDGPTAVAINLPRNSGLKDIEIC